MRMMSRKLIKESAEEMDNIPAELGPALKMLGTILQEEYMSRDGVYLNTTERKDNPQPIALVDDTVITVRVGNKRITMTPSDADKPAVLIPVGMSDKRNTCSIPRDWATGVWVDALIEAFDGDPSVAFAFAERVNTAIDLAMVVDEETGKKSVKQSDLPTHRHAVEVAEILESLKRHFEGQSAGSPKVNMDFTIEEIGATPVGPTAEEVEMANELAKLQRTEKVLNTLVPNPNVTPTQETPPVAQDNVIPVEASHPETTDPVPVVLEEETTPVVEVEDTVDSEPILGVTGHPEHIEHLIIEAINTADEANDGPDGQVGPTWGQLKKTLSDHTLRYVDTPDDIRDARRCLDKLVKHGLVNKEGARRSTRYYLTGSGLELLVGMPLPDVISQDLEEVSMAPSGDSAVAVSHEPHINAEAGGMSMWTNDPEVVQEVKDEWDAIIADSEPWDGHVEDTFANNPMPMAVIPHTGCANCDKPHKFVYEDLPVGPRRFCSEKCLCHYAALEYKGEGYYIESLRNQPMGHFEAPVDEPVDEEPVPVAGPASMDTGTADDPAMDYLGLGGGF